MNTMEHKGYIGSAEIDVEGQALVGKLLFIRDTITYSASDVAGLRLAFEEAVDDYLLTCQELGDTPDLPCKGSFNVRVGPDRHRQLAIEARKLGVSINDYVCQALDATFQKPVGLRVARPDLGAAPAGRYPDLHPSGLVQAMDAGLGHAVAERTPSRPPSRSPRKRAST